MPQQVYNYTLLREEFIRADPEISVRELGRRHGIPSERITAVHRAARKKDAKGRDWYALRAAYWARSIDEFSAEAARINARRKLRRAEVYETAVELLDEALKSAREHIAEIETETDDEGRVVAQRRAHPVQLHDVPKLIDRLAEVFTSLESDTDGGRLPSGSGDDPSTFLIAGGTGDLGRALLGAIASAGRGGSPVAVGRPVDGRALPVLEDPREDGQR